MHNMALLNLVFPPAVNTNAPEAKDDEVSDNNCDHCMKNREGLSIEMNQGRSREQVVLYFWNINCDKD